MVEAGKETQQKPLFDIEFDEMYDWDNLGIRLLFRKSPSEEVRKKIKSAFEDWTDEGYEKGYGEGKINDLINRDGDWGGDGRKVEFWMDMGMSSFTPALSNLWERLSDIKSIEKVKLGSGYSKWEPL
jgi:hypothetical protein